MPAIETERAIRPARPAVRVALAKAARLMGTEDRRLQVRAYSHWASLLNGRTYPSIKDLDFSFINGFEPYSALIDLTADRENPLISFIGAALREEAGIGSEVRRVEDLPDGSLLSLMIEQYPKMIIDRGPVGLEGEIVNNRGANLLYRGILLPFSVARDEIDFIYCVINWKIRSDASSTPDAAGGNMPNKKTALGASFAGVSGPVKGSSQDEYCDDAPSGSESHSFADEADLHERLAIARDTAEALKIADGRSRAALYRTLGLCFDFALTAEGRPDEYGKLLEGAGLKAQNRAPMIPIVKLVFGANYDKTRLAEFAAALSYGRRLGLDAGMLQSFLETHEGGLKGVIKAERRERRPARLPDPLESARTAMRTARPQAIVAIGAGEEEFLLLMARRQPDGSVAVLAPVPPDSGLVDRAIRKLAKIPG